MATRIRPLILLLAVFALVAAACSDSDDDVAASGAPAPVDDGTSDDDANTGGDTDENGDEAFPVTVTSGETETVIADRPEAIVSLSPAATEMLFAIGAGDQVIAVDDQSNFPAEAPTTELSGFEPNVEAIIATEPDLVLVQGDANDLLAGLAAVDIPTLILPAANTLDDTFTQIEIIGVATGRVGDAAELVAQMRAEVDELLAEVPERDEPVTFFHELDPSLYSATSSTFVGEIYALVGLVNVADAADPDGESFGYPQLSAEFLIEADPDLIFLADTKCCDQDAAALAERPGFDQLRAVQTGSVIELDDDVASRWGPRVVDFLRVVVEATAAVDVNA